MKVVTVTFSDEQYNILKKMRIAGDTDEDKLKSIFLEYASMRRDVQIEYEFYKRKLVWDKVMHILEMVWEAYEDGEDIEDVVARWSIEKIEAIEHILREYMSSPLLTRTGHIFQHTSSDFAGNDCSIS